MAKISLKEAVLDFTVTVLNEVYRLELKDREKVHDIIYSAMYRLSLSYLDRVDDVATKEMSLEIDRLSEINENIREENSRLHSAAFNRLEEIKA